MVKFLGMEMGTPIRNPVHRGNRYGNGFSKCTYCGRHYTQMGISRHWGKCPENPKNKEKVNG